MAAPMREFERRLLGESSTMGEPGAALDGDNVAVRQDPAGN